MFYILIKYFSTVYIRLRHKVSNNMEENFNFNFIRNKYEIADQIIVNLSFKKCTRR
jgi:hypothetical protein